MSTQHKNPNESHWRRISDYFLVRLILLAGCTFVLLIGMQVVAHVLAAATPSALKTSVFVVSTLIGSAVMIQSYRWGVYWLEHRDAKELGRTKIWLFVPGALFGVAIFILVYAILWQTGFVNYQGLGRLDGIARGCVSAFAAAVGEEIVFRGAVFRILEERFGTGLGLVASAGLFAVLHGANPGATVESTIAIALESGLLLAIAFVAARTLWLPVGIHFGWNFTEGSIFGAAVSGGKSVGVFKFSSAGPDSMTGGVFGPEASIVAVAVCCVASAFFLWIAIREGQWRSTRFRTDAATHG